MNEGNRDIPYQSLLKIFLAEKTEEKLHGMANRSFFAESEVGMVFIISADLYSLQVKSALSKSLLLTRYLLNHARPVLV